MCDLCVLAHSGIVFWVFDIFACSVLWHFHGFLHQAFKAIDFIWFLEIFKTDPAMGPDQKQYYFPFIWFLEIFNYVSVVFGFWFSSDRFCGFRFSGSILWRWGPLRFPCNLSFYLCVAFLRENWLLYTCFFVACLWWTNTTLGASGNCSFLFR